MDTTKTPPSANPAPPQPATQSKPTTTTPTVSLSGPKILLIGAAGSGKTYALGTMVEWAQAHDRKVHCLFVENGLESLLGYWLDRGKPIPPNLSYHVVTTKAIPLSSLIDASKKVGILSYKSITELVDPHRGDNNPYLRILESLTDFPNDRDGTKEGNIATWTSNDILCIDSLSELANACMKMVVGNKPTASQPDYGVSQNNLLNFLRYLTQGFQPTVVVISHVQRQTEELTGRTKLMVRAIGKAMADDIPQLFSEVLGCVRDGSNWYWDTADSSLDTKTRYLPIQSKITPNFSLIMDKWLKRQQ